MIISELLITYLLALQFFKKYALTKYILPSFFRLAALLLFLMAFNNNLGLHVLLAIIVSCFSTIVLAKFSIKLLVKPVNLSILFKFLKFSLPVSGAYILFNLYNALDVFLLNLYFDLKMIGYLAAMLMITGILDLIFAPFLNIFLVFLSPYLGNPSAGLKFTLKIILKLLAIGDGIAGIIFIIKSFLISKLLTSEFQAITPLIPYFLLLKVISEAVVAPIRQFLDFYGHVIVTLLLMMMAFIVKLVTAIWLLPIFGLTGVLLSQSSSLMVHLIGCMAIIFILNIRYQKRIKT